MASRQTEQATLDRLLAEVRAGQSPVLVLRGEAGVGKTVLLDYVQERAPDCRVVRAAGVESDMELAFAVDIALASFVGAAIIWIVPDRRIDRMVHSTADSG